MNVDKIYDVEVDWNGRLPDKQKFIDCYISSAYYEGRELTDAELEELMDNEPDWVYMQFEKWFY